MSPSSRIKPAVHIGFGRAEAGVAGDLSRHAAVGEADGDGPQLGIGRAIMVAPAPMVGDGELTAVENAPQRFVQKPHARRP